jgi:Sugar (and other) transporter
MTITVFFNYLINVIVVLVFPPAESWAGLGPCFIFFAIFMLIGFIYSSLDIVETKGKTREEINNLSAEKVNRIPLIEVSGE